MKTLNQTILDAARDEVQKEYGMTHAPFEKLQRSLQFAIFIKATELAMEKQAEFFRFIMENYMYDKRLDCYLSLKEMLKSYSELELYDIWREGK